MEEIVKRLSDIGIVPVVEIDNAEDGVKLAKALIDGGLPCAEITLRTDAGIEVIHRIHEAYPDMAVGAGTVLTCEQADAAKAAGAKFLVSPGLNPVVVKHAKEIGIPMVPGVCTPSEVEQGLALGLTELKFFPAEASGGLNFIKALSGPYTKVTFMPTGGLNQNNVRDYLANKKIWACGGSWIAKRDLIKNGDFEEIEKRAREASAIVKEVRGEQK